MPEHGAGAAAYRVGNVRTFRLRWAQADPLVVRSSPKIDSWWTIH
jgi:hypothetical protein